MSELKGVLAEMYEEGNIESWGLYKKGIKDADIVDTITDQYSPEWLPSYKFIETLYGYGEEHWTVFMWKGKYYKVKYIHKSHYGDDYYGDGSEIKEVTPKNVSVTIYE